MTEVLTPLEQFGLQEKLIQIAECLVCSSEFQPAASDPKSPSNDTIGAEIRIF